MDKSVEMDIVEDVVSGEDIGQVVAFSSPVVFEQKEYTEVDLSGLADISARDMIEAEKFAAGRGVAGVTAEMSLAYACHIASVASKKPVEFFLSLPARESVKVKNKVVGFIYGLG